MFFDGIDINEELQKAKQQKSKKPNAIISEIKNLLSLEAEYDTQVIGRLKENDTTPTTPLLKISQLDPKRIYSSREIKNICVKYRLRFLDTGFFKKDFPYDALIEIKAFERKHEVRIKKFKIVAPEKMFDLKDRNEDPLLFAEVADDTYYLLHQWGNNLSWYRKTLSYPIQSFSTFIKTILILATAMAIIIPKGMLIMNNPFSLNTVYYRMLFFAWFVIAGFFTVVFLGLTFHKNFSESDWNSPYFN